jgi:hypothetical protein
MLLSEGDHLLLSSKSSLGDKATASAAREETKKIEEGSFLVRDTPVPKVTPWMTPNVPRAFTWHVIYSNVPVNTVLLL